MMHWYTPPPKKIPVRKIVTSILGVIFLSFTLAHLMGKEMTRDGERVLRHRSLNDIKPSIPGPYQTSPSTSAP